MLPLKQSNSKPTAQRDVPDLAPDGAKLISEQSYDLALRRVEVARQRRRRARRLAVAITVGLGFGFAAAVFRLLAH